MRPARIAYFDTETTGLLDDEDARVVEVGCAIFDTATGDLLGTYESLVQPDVLTDEGLAICERISGITEAMLADAPIPEDVYDELGAFLEGWELPVRCWNLEFDQPMFRRSLCHPDPELAERYDQIRWMGCVMLEWTDRFSDYLNTHIPSGRKSFMAIRRAERLCAAQGVVLERQGQAHRALSDAIMTGRLDHVLVAERVVPAVMPSIQIAPDELAHQNRWPRWWERFTSMPVTGSIDPSTLRSGRFGPLPKTGAFDPSASRSNRHFGPMPDTGTFVPAAPSRQDDPRTGTFDPRTAS